jgi:excisionase family DNA binding protein
MMTPRARGPLAELLAEKKITAEQISGNNYRFTCQVCGAQWVPTLRKDGRLPTGYWRCPTGCNAPPEPAGPPEPKPEPVRDLAELPALLTADEVAAVLRLHPNTVKMLMRQGELPGKKIGGQWRLLKSELLAYLGAEFTRQPAEGDAHSAPRNSEK